MRTIVILLVCGLMTTPALAGLDPATDSFGVYFDTAGNVNCTTAGASQLVTAYLLLMNPANPTNGFECSVVMSGAAHFVVATTYANNGGNIDWELPPNVYIGVCPSNYSVPANGAALLLTWTIMIIDPAELLFYIGPSHIPSLPGGLPVVTGEGILRQCNVASGSASLPVAGINAGNCPVSEEINTFGAVKTLFR